MKRLLILSSFLFACSFGLSGCRILTGSSEPDAENPLSTITPPELATNTPATGEAAPEATEIPFLPISLSAPDCSYGGAFKSIEAVDRYTVRFTLCKADPAFLTKISLPAFSIQPEEWLLENGGGGNQLLENPVGSGPYRVSKWERGKELVFEAFEGYWGEPKARLSPLVFHWEPSAQQRLLQVMAGMVDGVDSIGPEYYEQISSFSNLNLIIRPPLNIAYLGINNTTAPFDQEMVRQAIAMAIDREHLLQVAFPLGYQMAGYFTPCSLAHACEGEAWYPFDPRKAKELLNQAGYPIGFQTNLLYRGESFGYMPWPDRVAAEISRQLRVNLGLDITPSVVESEAFLSAVDSGQIQGLFLLGWGADFPEVTNFLDTHFGSGATAAFGNPFPDIVQALENGANTAEGNRAAFYAAANEGIKTHVPVIPLAHGGWDSQESLGVVYQKEVEGANSSFYGTEAMHLLWSQNRQAFTWLQPKEPVSLYCPDEVDPASLQACAQVTETLYRLEPGGLDPKPNLAEICVLDETLLVWTCSLRQGIQFHDASYLDANDVVTGFILQWDARHPLHKGNTGAFTYFKLLFGNFLNSS